MKSIISLHWEITVEEHQKTHHVLSVSNFLALSRQCASIFVTDTFEGWISQVPGEGALMTRGFVRVQMGCECGLCRI